MEVIDSVEREADGGERAREPAPIRLRHGGGTQRSACSQTSRGSCGRNRKGVTAGTERHCKSVHTRRYAVRLARRECVSASEDRARGRTAAAGMVPGMAGMVPFSWCGTSGGVSTYIHAKKNVHSGPAFQDTSVLWRSKCSKTSPVLCGEDAVSQLFAPNGKIPQRHTIYIPSLTIFTKRLPKKACVRRGHWPGARHIAACARHGIYVALCTRWHPRRILPHEQHTIAGCLCARAAVRAFVAGVIPCSWQRRVWASSRPSPSAFSVQVVDDSVVLQPSRRTLRRSLG